jgi:quinoprotein glucose dehydrogenase
MGSDRGSRDWLYHGGDPGSTKFSPLDQIDRGNVNRLQVAWRWESPDDAIRAAHPSLAAPFLHEVTPIAVGGVLYVSTSYSLAAAIDGVTGQTRWTYDPGTWKRNAFRPAQAVALEGVPPTWGFTHRGLAYWGEGASARVYLATGDGYLISLDAATGRPDSGFGRDGIVDLTRDLSRPVARDPPGKLVYGVSSPPIVCGGRLVVGSNISDGVAKFDGPPGDVRGFNLETGALEWRFNTVPREGEYGAETWDNGSWKNHGSANVWSLMSCDPETGWVYLPLTSTTNDYYGGERPGNNLFAESIVALDGKTGARKWHFQVTHHGLWDYDLPAAPILGEIRVDGRAIKAVVQVTKQGFVFVLDRATGAPVWPIEERPVPTDGAADGERPSPVQPFPTVPAPFERQGVVAENLIDFTPELAREALAIMQAHRHGPLYTPPSERGTLVLPGRTGGAKWGGAAFDSGTGVLYVPSQSLVDLYQLGPGGAESDFRYRRIGGAYAEGPRGLPLVKPPYGRLTAIGLNDGGKHRWMTPVGDGPRNHPALRDLKLPRLGSARFRFPLLTGGSLLFLSEGRAAGREFDWWGTESQETMTALEQSVLRVFDKTDGRLLWQYRLPGPGSALPMTYQRGGRQFVVVAVGGMGLWKEELIAFALPQTP